MQDEILWYLGLTLCQCIQRVLPRWKDNVLSWWLPIRYLHFNRDSHLLEMPAASGGSHKGQVALSWNRILIRAKVAFSTPLSISDELAGLALQQRHSELRRNWMYFHAIEPAPGSLQYHKYLNTLYYSESPIPVWSSCIHSRLGD